MKKLTIVIIAIFTILVSCRKDSNNKPNGSLRTIRYEVTGNYTGNFTVAYQNALGELNNEQAFKLPWSKEITYSPNVSTASIIVSGGEGVLGQKVTLVIKRGSTQIGTPIEKPVNSSGFFSIQEQVTTF